MIPAAFTIYKSSAALRLQLLPAKPKEEGSPYLSEGCVMLEMAKAKGEANERGNRTYDWASGKIIFKMSSKDVGDVLSYLVRGADGEVKLIHDSSKVPGSEVQDDSKYKTLYINKGDKGWFWSLTIGKDDRVSAPVDMSEMVRIRQLLSKSIERIYGW